MKADPNASTPTQYIASVPENRRPAIRKLKDLNLETVEAMIRKAEALHQEGNFCQ